MQKQTPSSSALNDSPGPLMAVYPSWRSEMVFEPAGLARRVGRYKPKLIGNDLETLTMKAGVREFSPAKTRPNIRISMTKG